MLGDPGIELSQSKCQTARIDFKTSATLLQDLLPSPSYRFKSKDTVAYASLRLQSYTNLRWLGGQGYHSLGFYIHGVEYVKSSGETTDGSYPAVIFEDCPESIVHGREELGLPVVFSQIDVQEDKDIVKAILNWRGIVWARLTWPALQKQHVATNGSTIINGNHDAEKILVHKYTPAREKKEDLELDTSCRVLLSQDSENDTLLSQQTCIGTATVSFDPLDSLKLPTLHHIVSRLNELPIFEIVEASVVESRGFSDSRRAAIVDNM